MDLETMLVSVWDAVVTHRRWLHAHPELSGQEKKTAAYIAAALRKIGLEPEEHVGGYGVTALIRGNLPGKCLGLRADFDALPIREDTGLPFASENPDISHACGHDMHAAMLLGVAQVLYGLRERFAGSVKLIFQPSEENAADSGAKKMIDQGVLEEPQVDAMLAQHVSPHYPTGTVALRSGAMSASSDRFSITLHGKSSHGSEPEGGVDAVTIGAQVISALQTIISRTVSAQDSAVLSIGTVTAGSRYNIIADSFCMEGTCRTLEPELQQAMPERMERIIGGIAQSMGGTYSFCYTRGFCPVMNDTGICALVQHTAKECLGERQLVIQQKAAMIGEDFSFFARAVPSAFYWLGCRDETEPFYPLHSNRFAPQEEAMRTGIRVMVSTALAYLK